MDREYSESVKELTEDEAWVVLFLLLLQGAARTAFVSWKELENNIKNQNRFFPQPSVVETIKTLQDIAILEIPEGATFYRARLFKDSFLDEPRHSTEREHILDIVKKAGLYEKIGNITDLYRLARLDPTLLIGQESGESLPEAIKTVLMDDKQWWGYDQRGSDAPPNERAAAGRANSKNISVLYIADDEKTAIYEVRPSIGQEVSIATIVTNKPLKVYDLCAVPEIGGSEIEAYENYYLFQMLSSLFSEVNYGSGEEYFPTQYICDYIKSLGLDGIRYCSAINPEGKVVVLFETNGENPDNHNYEIIGSKVYRVNKYIMDYTQIAPWVG